MRFSWQNVSVKRQCATSRKHVDATGKQGSKQARGGLDAGMGGRPTGHFFVAAMFFILKLADRLLQRYPLLAWAAGGWVSWTCPPASHRQQHQWGRSWGWAPPPPPRQECSRLQRPPPLPAGTATLPVADQPPSQVEVKPTNP